LRVFYFFIQRATKLIERIISSAQLYFVSKAGYGCILGRGVRIEHPECLFLGNGVHINDECWFSIITKNLEVGSSPIELHPKICIGDRTYIGRFGTFSCINKITIGNNVMISDRVFIGDAEHGFSRTDLPIRDQYMASKGSVEIGDGTWIGIGVSVLSNVKIGQNCVIGAGSVVTKDIPDFCIAAGVPARIMGRVKNA